MNSIREFLDRVNWKRVGKVVLTIIPVILWELWYQSIKFIAKVNESINEAGDKFLSDFMNK